MATHIGVDIGGTFTDIVCFDDETGEVSTLKVSTTPFEPELGCIEGLQTLLPASRWASCADFIHATTVGLNTVLERKGARLGLLVTQGFRDVIEIRKGLRDAWHDLEWQAPAPLVPRASRLGIGGRISAAGDVLCPLDEAALRDALALFSRQGIEAIAVCFMNAYANPAHERQARSVLTQCGYAGAISLSHELSGDYRDFERMSTTVVDCIVKARLANYLHRLGSYLDERGHRGSRLITKSGGGAMHFAEARTKAFETINSGPAAGVYGAAQIARRLALGDMITIDIGGTSSDAALVRDYQPHLVFQGSVGGVPIQAPWVDVRSVGAGGGSIARLDGAGRLLVGPDSAGARPGPACYGKGGLAPTITDAACHLGMLGEHALGQGVAIDRDRARAALAPLAAATSMPLDGLAVGILRIACASIASTIRGLTIEQGIAPAGLALFVYGGAGPLFACQLGEAMGARTIVIPQHAGNFCAWGMLGTEVTHTASARIVSHISSTGLRHVNAKIDWLLGDMLSALPADRRRQAVCAVHLDMRYKGQEHALPVEMPLSERQIALPPQQVKDRFHGAYAKAYFQALDKPVEIVAVRVSVRQPLAGRTLAERPMPTSPGKRAAYVNAYSVEGGSWMDFLLVERRGIEKGRAIVGPAIVTEATTTIYVDAGFEAAADELGCLRLSRG